MGSKKSSFHMGDEFNGKGEKVYLRATTCKTYEPLSQENVRLTPDFKACVPKVLGAVPLMGAGGELGQRQRAHLPPWVRPSSKRTVRQGSTRSVSVSVRCGLQTGRISIRANRRKGKGERIER